ncbi:replication initiator [Streptomyces sp. NPDC003011]
MATRSPKCGGCTNPIRLDGHRTEYDVDTRTGEIGNVLHRLDSSDLPAGHLLVGCNNRRTTRGAACSEVYRRDTFHLITSGLRGGKGTPERVAAHPRVFATFTAPSFGPVHNRPTGPARTVHPCRCGTLHDQDDPALGTPLDPETYDYEAAVLWNAHAGPLWRRFSTYLRREVAKRAGLTQRAFREHARVSFAKVAEYQKRGAVHFHAVIGLPDPLIKILRQHQDVQERERVAAGADWEGKGYVFASPVGGPLSPNTDFHVWKRILRDAGVRDGRLHDARHTAATVLLILGVPDVVIDSIMGWEPGGAARMRARYMHVTGTMLRKVAQQVGDALWVLPGTGTAGVGGQEKTN